MKAAIYARVSTDRQESLNQLAELRAYCARQSWEIAGEYVDEDVRGKAERKPQLESLLLHAHQKRFNVAVFWALDRLTRKGVKDAIDILHRLGASGVDFVSYREPYLSSLGPFRDMVVSILATLANFESARLSERITAGIRTRKDAAKASGERFLWGQARISKLRADPSLPSRVAALRAQGRSWGEIAKALKIPVGTARRYHRYATGAESVCLLDGPAKGGEAREGAKGD